MLARVIEPTYKGEMDDCSTVEVRNSLSRDTSRRCLRASLIITLSYDQGHWQMATPQSRQGTNDPDPLGMKIWVTAPG